MNYYSYPIETLCLDYLDIILPTVSHFPRLSGSLLYAAVRIRPVLFFGEVNLSTAGP